MMQDIPLPKSGPHSGFPVKEFTKSYSGATDEPVPGAHRTLILETASNLITGPRAKSYGDFGDQMRGLAEAFNGIKGREVLDAKDVALLLMILKLRRLETGWELDSAVDLCGYAALAGEHFTKK